MQKLKVMALATVLVVSSAAVANPEAADTRAKTAAANAATPAPVVQTPAPAAASVSTSTSATPAPKAATPAAPTESRIYSAYSYVKDGVTTNANSFWNTVWVERSIKGRIFAATVAGAVVYAGYKYFNSPSDDEDNA